MFYKKLFNLFEIGALLFAVCGALSISDAAPSIEPRPCGNRKSLKNSVRTNSCFGMTIASVRTVPTGEDDDSREIGFTR